MSATFHNEEFFFLPFVLAVSCTKLPCGSRFEFNGRQSIMKIRPTNNREIHLSFPCGSASASDCVCANDCACDCKTGTANKPPQVIYFPICCTEGFNMNVCICEW